MLGIFNIDAIWPVLWSYILGLCLSILSRNSEACLKRDTNIYTGVVLIRDMWITFACGKFHHKWVCQKWCLLYWWTKQMNSSLSLSLSHTHTHTHTYKQVIQSLSDKRQTKVASCAVFVSGSREEISTGWSRCSVGAKYKCTYSGPRLVS